jgi:hypothetical protein
MKHFVVEADSLIGKHNKRYRKGDLISEDHVHAAHVDSLVTDKILREATPEEMAAAGVAEADSVVVTPTKPSKPNGKDKPAKPATPPVA